MFVAITLVDLVALLKPIKQASASPAMFEVRNE